MALARSLFSSFDNHWAGDDIGMDRAGYSARENEAIDMVKAQASAMGMDSYQDLAGNAYFIYRGADSTLPVFMMGSHLDAVPRGGRYDGPAGVVAGLAAIKAIHDSNVRPAQDICLTVFRNEESPWFGQFAVGSKLACGQLSAEFLQAAQKDDGRTLYAHMNEVGLNPAALEAALNEGQILLPIEQIGQFVELHIEQGSQLEKANKSLGIVSGIRGNLRFPKKIDFHGNAGHSGAVPQAERRDAVLAGVDFLAEFKALCIGEQANGNDLVWSCPIAHTGAGASPTTIPDFFTIQPEIRSLSPELLARMKTKLLESAQNLAAALNVRIDIKPETIITSAPSLVSPQLQSKLEDTAQSLGIDTMRIASGAGHDAAILAQAGVDAGMMFMRHGNQGASHRPDEIMTQKEGDDAFSLSGDFANAINVLAHMAVKKASQNEGQAHTNFVQGLLQKGATPL